MGGLVSLTRGLGCGALLRFSTCSPPQLSVPTGYDGVPEETVRADPLTPEQRSRTMSRVRAKDTGPEVRVRRVAHRLGYRFRLHRSDLPGRPDLVFPRLRKVVLVHGCFWHGHDCRQGRKKPKTNAAYWLPKLERNRDRDAANLRGIRRLGWRPLVVWECQLGGGGIESRLKRFLEDNR